MFYDIYVDLCKNKGISPSKAAQQIGLSRTSVVKWKNGTVPSGATLNSVANFFGVSVDFLIGQADEILCPQCGFLYSPLTQNEEHEKYHIRWKKAVDQFGFCWDYREASRIRLKSIQIINDRKSTENEILDAFDNYLRAEFSLSLRNSGFDLNHVSFKEFCSIQLSKWESKDAVSDDIYKKLISKYGIDNSNYYHPVTNEKLTPTNKGEPDITFNDFTYALHNETKELTEENKQKLLEMARFFKEQQDKEKNR